MLLFSVMFLVLWTATNVPVPWMFIVHNEIPAMSRWLMGLSFYNIAYHDSWQRHGWAFWFYKRRVNNYNVYPVWGSSYSGVWRRISRKLDPDYPLTQRHIPEERNPALHRCANLKKISVFIGSVYCTETCCEPKLPFRNYGRRNNFVTSWWPTFEFPWRMVEVYSYVSRWTISSPWRWSQYVTPKRRKILLPHGVETQKKTVN